MTEHDPLTTLLPAARTDIDTVPAQDLSRGLAAAVRAESRPRARRAVVAGLAVLAVAVPGTAAAVQWTTHTGVFGNPALSEEDASEWLDVCAPDFPATVRRLSPRDLALPRGVTVDTAVQDMYGEPDPACPEPGGRAQADGITLDFESWARCAWVHAWLDDPTQRSAAVVQLTRLADSPLLAAHDGGGTVAHAHDVAAAAADDDRAPVQREAEINCAQVGLRR